MLGGGRGGSSPGVFLLLSSSSLDRKAVLRVLSLLMMMMISFGTATRRRMMTSSSSAAAAFVHPRRVRCISHDAAATSASTRRFHGTASGGGGHDDVTTMRNCLYRIRRINRLPSDVRDDTLWTWHVDDDDDDDATKTPLGYVHPDAARRLCETDPTVFVVRDERRLTLHRDIAPTRPARTAAIGSVLERLRDRGVIPGWRDERYPLATSFDEDPVVLVERAAVPFLGALEYGVHVNGLVDSDDGDDDDDRPIMWMARRSQSKSKYPGMMDHLVAGGQPAGWTVFDNAVKECQEEAGIDEHTARTRLRPVGAVSYATYDATSSSSSLPTVTRAVLFNYDLHLPSDFVPTPVDGEVEDFVLWSVNDLKASLAPDFHDPLKPNCYLPVIDWLMRRGHLSPDTPGYLDVLRELRSGDCR